MENNIFRNRFFGGIRYFGVGIYFRTWTNSSFFLSDRISLGFPVRWVFEWSRSNTWRLRFLEISVLIFWKADCFKPNPTKRHAYYLQIESDKVTQTCDDRTNSPDCTLNKVQFTSARETWDRKGFPDSSEEESTGGRRTEISVYFSTFFCAPNFGKRFSKIFISQIPTSERTRTATGYLRSNPITWYRRVDSGVDLREG